MCRGVCVRGSRPISTCRLLVALSGLLGANLPSQLGRRVKTKSCPWSMGGWRTQPHRLHPPCLILLLAPTFGASCHLGLENLSRAPAQTSGMGLAPHSSALESSVPLTAWTLALPRPGWIGVGWVFLGAAMTQAEPRAAQGGRGKTGGFGVWVLQGARLRLVAVVPGLHLAEGLGGRQGP